MVKEENGRAYWTSNNYYYLGHEKVALDNIVKIIISYELMTIYINGRLTPYTVYWYFSPEKCADDYQRLKDGLKSRGRVLKNIETDCGFGVYVEPKEEVDRMKYMKRVKSKEKMLCALSKQQIEEFLKEKCEEQVNAFPLIKNMD